MAGCALSRSHAKMREMHDGVANLAAALTFAKVGLRGTRARRPIGTRSSRRGTRVDATRWLGRGGWSSRRGDMRRGRMRHNGGVLLCEEELAVDELLMKLVKRYRAVTAFNNIDNMMVVIVQALQDKLNKVLMIKGLAESSKFVRAAFNKLHELRDGARALRGAF